MSGEQPVKSTEEQQVKDNLDVIPVVDEESVSPRELKGWYIYNLAVEVYNVVAITVFIPIILETLSSQAGYKLDRVTPCDTTLADYQCVTKFGTSFVDTASFSLYIISISVLLQAFVYIGCGALADHGANRKKFLFGFSYAGAICTILFVAIRTPDLYWLAGVLAILSNVCFGASFVFYLAFLPNLARGHPLVKAAKMRGETEAELHIVEDGVSNRISSHGMAVGYAGGVLVLILAAGLVLFLGSTNIYSMQIGTALAGVWWLVWLTVPLKWLKNRPGPPLPQGESFLFFSWKRVGKTIASTSQLWQTMKYLIAWFLLSDGFNTISSVAILFGKKQLNLGQQQLLMAAVIIPIVAIAGVYFFNWFQRKLGLTTKTMILITACLHGLIPVYGLLGFVTPIGLKNTWEIWVFAVYFGFMLGAIQSYCRVLFTQLLPPGQENEFFALYEITDKGSSWVGPLVTGLIADQTHDLRYAFFFLLAMMLIPTVMIATVNVEKGKRDAQRFAQQQEQHGLIKIEP